MWRLHGVAIVMTVWQMLTNRKKYKQILASTYIYPQFYKMSAPKYAHKNQPSNSFKLILFELNWCSWCKQIVLTDRDNALP